MLCVVLSFASFGVMAQTAHLGGQIRHSELRNDTTISTESENVNSETDEKNKNEKDDD
jgi:hypothetical protein